MPTVQTSERFRDIERRFGHVVVRVKERNGRRYAYGLTYNPATGQQTDHYLGRVDPETGEFYEDIRTIQLTDERVAVARFLLAWANGRRRRHQSVGPKHVGVDAVVDLLGTIDRQAGEPEP